MINTNAIMTIAKKEFSDKLYERSSLFLIAIFMGTLFVYIQYSSNFSDIAQIIAVYFPLIGIALGYDAIITEKNSKSLNLLLTHPVYRDNIIVGKYIGICLDLFCIVFSSLMLIMAYDFLISGKVAQLESITRLFIFGFFTFCYLLIFASFGVLTSTILKSEISSLTLGVVTWINLCFALGPSMIMLTSIITGESFFDITDKFNPTINLLFNISPIHHFAEVTVGLQDLSYGTFNTQHEINGFLDTRYTISYLLDYYWQNVLVLLVLPITLIIGSYVSFMREDI